MAKVAKGFAKAGERKMHFFLVKILYNPKKSSTFAAQKNKRQ